METKTNFKYVAYARKSTDQEEKQITSIDDQLREIKRIGEGCNVTKTFIEKRSAKTSVDGGQIIWMLQNGIIKEIRTDDGVYSSGDDMIMLYIHFGMANQFSLNLSKDVKRGLTSRVEEGVRPSI